METKDTSFAEEIENMISHLSNDNFYIDKISQRVYDIGTSRGDVPELFDMEQLYDNFMDWLCLSVQYYLGVRFKIGKEIRVLNIRLATADKFLEKYALQFKLICLCDGSGCERNRKSTYRKHVYHTASSLKSSNREFFELLIQHLDLRVDNRTS